MPATLVIYYKDDDGSVPVRDFMASVPRRERQKLILRLSRLRELGRELRRPEADYLRDGIYELGVRFGHVNYRILYFFQGSTISVLAAGLTKKDVIPPREIDNAIDKMKKFGQNPSAHTWHETEE